MTLDTEKGELTLFNSEQVSLGTYKNEDFKNGVFYPACTVYDLASKVSMMKLTSHASSAQNQKADLLDAQTEIKRLREALQHTEHTL